MYCAAKSVCPPFWENIDKIELPVWSNILIGTQASSLKRSKIGGATLEINIERSSIKNGLIRVTRFFDARFPDFKDVIGQKLIITNLKRHSEKNEMTCELTLESQIVLVDGGA